MPIQWEIEPGKMVVFHISGKITPSEVKILQTDVTPTIKEGTVERVLIILGNFRGWESAPGWEDTSMAEVNDQYISRIAVVGDEKWHEQAMLYLLAGLRPVEITYFSQDDEIAARLWLTEEHGQ